MHKQTNAGRQTDRRRMTGRTTSHQASRRFLMKSTLQVLHKCYCQKVADGCTYLFRHPYIITENVINKLNTVVDHEERSVSPSGS